MELLPPLGSHLVGSHLGERTSIVITGFQIPMKIPSEIPIGMESLQIRTLSNLSAIALDAVQNLVNPISRLCIPPGRNAARILYQCFDFHEGRGVMLPRRPRDQPNANPEVGGGSIAPSPECKIASDSKGLWFDFCRYAFLF